ncbi:hypothetical protein CYY_008520 [Polysphondylium violaceum]|uniref:Pre-mRNA-splicing factor 18 n=1 Tax=Polysphondylium violaceum TaxID=133409 RepID=A0A8J4PN22_9MYCE|nr:hypothetical protein CYY_008520 [Polysphondylium violaceum]
MKSLKEQLQIEKKRKEALLNKDESSINSNTSTADQQPTKKYKTRGEIEKEQREKKEEEKRLKQKLKDSNNNNNNNDIDKDKVKQLDQQEKEKEEEKKKLREPFLPKHIVIQRLRERKQPITYFGEDDYTRAERLRHLEEDDPIEYTKGENEFANILKQIESNQKFKKDDQLDSNSSSNSNNNKTDKDSNGKKDDNNYLNMDLSALFEESKKSKEAGILFFLTGLMREWQENLDNRAEEEKKSRQGKLTEATFVQCLAHIQPLFNQLTAKTLPDDILQHIHGIVESCKAREYVKANDEYLQMAIGNAPWPMGVTMVGIHERSSREKIFSNQVAHVLNDETQRKYIQAVKRLITFCQTQYPALPSKCVG